MRGGANFASFATGKFAMRALTQSLAREFGPKGVHVSHAIIDGIIDIPRTKEWKVDAPDGKISPEAVSDLFFVLALLSRVLLTRLPVRLPMRTGFCTRSRERALRRSLM